MTNTYECITACVAMFLVAVLLALAMRSCTEHSVRRLELGYPESGWAPYYPKPPTKEQTRENADIPLPGGDSQIFR